MLTRALSVLNAILIAAAVGFALTDGFVLAVILLWTAGVVREVQAPPSRAWINHDLDPRARATINSIGGQADALGQIAGGPGIGALALGGSVRAALVASGLAPRAGPSALRSSPSASHGRPRSGLHLGRPRSDLTLEHVFDTVATRAAPRGSGRCPTRMAFRARSTRGCRCTT